MWFVRWHFKFRHLVGCGEWGTVTLILIACSLHLLVQTSCCAVVNFRKQPVLWKIELFSFCLTYCRRTEQTQQQVQALWSVLVSDYCYKVPVSSPPPPFLPKWEFDDKVTWLCLALRKIERFKNSCRLRATEKTCKENLLEWVKWKFVVWRLLNTWLTWKSWEKFVWG